MEKVNLILEILFVILGLAIAYLSQREVEYDRIGGYSTTGSYILVLAGLALVLFGFLGFLSDFFTLIN